MGDQQQQLMKQDQQLAVATPDADAKLKRVILIRLPPGQQNPTSANPRTSPIPPNLITHIVNNELRNTSNMATQNTSNNNNNNNDPTKTVANTSTVPGDDNNTTNTTNAHGTKKGSRGDREDAANYKNYSPKQREWMLVYLGYARGLLGRDFEERLPDAIIQKTNEILGHRGRFCSINRTPSSKTLRAVWKNLWKEERTVATIIKKGGRPRIDPIIKREKRNERERRKRAAARELKEARKAEAQMVTTDTQT